jgi:DNA-binding Lrp family transcriptional regulator
MEKQIDTNTYEAIKLDMKDRKILYELDMDARQSISQIAKKVRLSKETVNYRMKQLEKKGIIEGYYAVINSMLLGYSFYRIFMKFQNISPAKEEEIINYLKKLPSVGWLTSTEGTFELAVVIWAKYIYEFEEEYNKFFYKYGRYVRHKEFSIATRIWHFRRRYLYEKKEGRLILAGGKKVDIDKIDYDILHILAANSRTPIIDIAAKLRLSSNTVKYRIKRLIDEGVILGFRTKINANLFGYQHYKIFLTLKDITKEKRDELIRELSSHQNVVYITEPIGQADLEFEMDMRSSAEVHNMLKALRSKFNIIRDYEVCLDYYDYQVNYLPKGLF